MKINVLVDACIYIAEEHDRHGSAMDLEGMAKMFRWKIR